jgi:Uma2 family endonuclease
MVATRTSGTATAADLEKLERFEVIAGSLHEKAAPSAEHGDSQGALAAVLRSRFHRRGSGSNPGGWWILTEVEIEFETHEVYVPDVAGWRRDRLAHRPSGRPVRVQPDWVCEILSPSTASHDQVTKQRTFHRCGVKHYWIVDPERQVLTVQRWQKDGYLVLLTAGGGETVRAEPFDAIELAVGLLFGDDPPDEDS